MRAMIATWEPKREKAWPHSRPMEPAPMTASRRGSSVRFQMDAAVR